LNPPRPPLNPMTPWRWLQQAAALLRSRPRAIGGATSLLLAVALAPSVVEALLMPVSPGLAQGLMVALSVLLYPPVVAGYFRLLHLLAQGAQLPASTVFAVFKDGRTVRRMILANLIFVCGSLLLVSTAFFALGGEALLAWFREVSVAAQAGAKTLAPIPAGAFPLIVVLMLFAAAMVTIQALASALIALSGRAPLPAIGHAIAATARSFGLLLLFYVPISVFAFLAFMFVALSAALVGAALGALVPALAPAVVLVASVVVALAMYALLFCFFYFAWRELFGEELPPAPEAQHEIAA
jgi:hypothetical protein